MFFVAEAGRRRRITGLAGLVLLMAVAAGLFGQGAYYPPVRWYVGGLVAAATVLALVASPPTRADARLGPVVPALLLAGWAALVAALHGVLAAGAGPALLLLGMVAVLLACRRLDQEDREVLLIGITGISLVVALAGWLGVVGRADSWVWQDPDVWRASSTLTYPNAAAAVLVSVALVTLARLVAAPRSLPLALAATGLLVGVGATMSRAGALALAVGLLVLAGLRGPGRTARAAVGPCVGALLALVCLLPSMPATSPPQPGLALVGLAAGLALAAIVARLERRSAVVLVLGAAAVGALVALLVVGGGGAVRTVTEARINLASPDRGGALRAALGVIAANPLLGTGPGQANLRWRGPDGVTESFAYAHNEYAQVAAELGLVGLTLLAVLLVAFASLLWSARSTSPLGAAWAGVAAATTAFAVHSSLDFIWHLPAVPLTVTLLAGAVLPSSHGTDAHMSCLTAQNEESHESQATN